MSGSLKQVRERIRSVQNTQQITKAMKVVSAAKFRKAQQAIVQMRPYAEKLNAMLRNILSNMEGEADTVFGVQRPVHKACVVVVTSNRGLCGAFNTNVIKGAVRIIQDELSEQRRSGNLSILCIGKRGYDFFRKRYTDCQIISDHVDLFQNLNFEHVAPVAGKLMDAFQDKTYDRVYVAFGHFRNAATQFPMVEQWLPVAKIQPEPGARKKRADYIFEPDMKGLLNYLVPSILQTTFHRYLLDTHASEHGARMTAMDKATENAEDLLKELRINYNKARQEAITKEILEIVGGAAALESA
jgi:F-type H+-transporting ATPase subunit gamma